MFRAHELFMHALTDVACVVSKLHQRDNLVFKGASVPYFNVQHQNTYSIVYPEVKRTYSFRDYFYNM